MIRQIKNLLERKKKTTVLDEILNYDEIVSFLRSPQLRYVNPEIEGWCSYYDNYTGNREEAKISYRNLGLDPAIEFIERHFRRFGKPELNPHLWFCWTRHKVITQKPDLENLMRNEVIGETHDFEVAAGMNDNRKPKVYGEIRIKLYNAYDRNYYLKEAQKRLSGLSK